MIVAAALRDRDDNIYTGKRHVEIYKKLGQEFFDSCEEGFITDVGEFLNRRQAAVHAYDFKQINYFKEELSSEDLW